MVSRRTQWDEVQSDCKGRGRGEKGKVRIGRRRGAIIIERRGK